MKRMIQGVTAAILMVGGVLWAVFRYIQHNPGGLDSAYGIGFWFGYFLWPLIVFGGGVALLVNQQLTDR